MMANGAGIRDVQEFLGIHPLPQLNDTHIPTLRCDKRFMITSWMAILPNRYNFGLMNV